MLGARWPAGDRPLAREASSAIVRPVAFPLELPRPTEMPVQPAALALVGPDVAIDGLVADPELALAAQPAGHLLGTPILSQQLLDPCPLRGAEPLVPAGTRATAPGVPVRQLGPVAAVAGGLVAPHLPGNGTAMAPEDPGDRRRREAPLAEQAHAVSFRIGDLAVSHGRLRSLGREQKSTVRQITFLVRARVALSL